ncbi:histidine kinase [Pseudalgibacter alginicilyticus]|uniref:histidine kinase n=1 Tax=Pseudalgibacter alginicilyticus TaxID=1736674 RepID=A0A0P0D1Q7_9FLAO|nr:ATP-binding protein [Pseudalgibacter alginicilyticus]ALJ03693.1 histidine kinase [Pseudalgibacter alginicilyticus]
MNFKQLYTSSKTYIVLLFAAIIMLLVTTSITYRQIMLTQQSADKVVHTLQVYNVIADLTTHFTKAQSEEFREDLLNHKNPNTVFDSYKLEGKSIIDTLKVLTKDNTLHSARIKPLESLLDKLYSLLIDLDSVDYQDSEDTILTNQSQKAKINNTLVEIKSIKDRMLSDENRLMNERKVTYISHKSFTPNMLLILAFFALFVFVISFFRIYNNKLKVRKSEAFLKSVLATTDNIVNYYEPIFDTNNKIIDFKIIYANDCNRDYLGLEPDDIMEKTVLNVYPLHTSLNEIEELIDAYENKDKVIFDRQIFVEEKKMWFHSLATPLVDGVLVTSRNSTADEESKEMELALKNRLENQNLMLLDNRAFLTNIFKSISHIVMHYKSIREQSGKIIDFEVLFVNDKISPVTGDIPDDIKNKKLSEVFPNTFNSGVFEHLVSAVENDKAEEYEVPFTKNGQIHWFKATAIKLGDGVTITIRDVTEEKEKANELVNLNEQLVIQNSILTEAERIAKIGNFIWYLDTGVSEISDNFYLMLGCKIKEFEPSLDKYREFVHPEDLNQYDSVGAKVLTEQEITEYTYRVITKQNTIKHFKTNGQFINKNGKRVMIGVVQDVTESIQAEAMLLKSNLELKNKNNELESFNRVASHDLQEPLRKIQLFALRIKDTEADNFSDRSADYFGKVIKAVSRMQSLIENLLTYSKINVSKKDFEKVDLNHVFDKVKEDLTSNIGNTYYTEIVSDKLPKIMGVTFQMDQLFTNLISNAIKYKRVDEVPKIKIHYAKVSATEMPDFIPKAFKQYHKISFIDNGIGFKQQYAEKIFEVFQRLHQKNEYSGTGIGLAICKKIVENHSGYITAKGTENIGAQFDVYLPEQ